MADSLKTLRTELKKLGLSPTGTKMELMERLKKARQEKLKKLPGTGQLSDQETDNVYRTRAYTKRKGKPRHIMYVNDVESLINFTLEPPDPYLMSEEELPELYQQEESDSDREYFVEQQQREKEPAARAKRIIGLTENEISRRKRIKMHGFLQEEFQLDGIDALFQRNHKLKEQSARAAAAAGVPIPSLASSSSSSSSSSLSSSAPFSSASSSSSSSSAPTVTPSPFGPPTSPVPTTNGAHDTSTNNNNNDSNNNNNNNNNSNTHHTYNRASSLYSYYEHMMQRQKNFFLQATIEYRKAQHQHMQQQQLLLMQQQLEHCRREMENKKKIIEMLQMYVRQKEETMVAMRRAQIPQPILDEWVHKELEFGLRTGAVVVPPEALESAGGTGNTSEEGSAHEQGVVQDSGVGDQLNGQANGKGEQDSDTSLDTVDGTRDEHMQDTSSNDGDLTNTSNSDNHTLTSGTGRDNDDNNNNNSNNNNNDNDNDNDDNDDDNNNNNNNSNNNNNNSNSNISIAE